MRRRIIIGLALGAGFAAVPAIADVLEVERDSILNRLRREQVVHHRSLCVTGGMPAEIARERAAGFRTLSAGAYCVTILTRAGRDGALRYITLKGGETTPATAFDTGFVSAYLKREALPAGAPPMTALLPLADGCLDQKEPRPGACHAVGYMLGLRAAKGELVPVQ